VRMCAQLLGVAVPSHVKRSACEEKKFEAWADSGFATQGRLK
jgi:hypothetical protein